MARWPVRHEGSLVIRDRDSEIEATTAAGAPGFPFAGDAFVANVLKGNIVP